MLRTNRPPPSPRRYETSLINGSGSTVPLRRQQPRGLFYREAGFQPALTVPSCAVFQPVLSVQIHIRFFRSRRAGSPPHKESRLIRKSRLPDSRIEFISGTEIPEILTKTQPHSVAKTRSMAILSLAC